jgi:hypothetical protein
MIPTAEDLLREFQQNRGLLAFRLSSSELPGIFSRKLAIPSGSAALVLQSDGTASMLSAGQEVNGKFEAVLVRIGDLSLSLGFLGLRTQDGFAIDARVSLVLRIDHRTVATLRSFSQFMGGAVYRQKDLEEYVADRVRAICGSVASASLANALHGKDVSLDMETRVSEKMQTHLMGTGLIFEKVIAVEFLSRDYERDVAQATQTAKEAKQREKRIKELAEFLQREGSVKSLLEQVQDPKLKSMLYARLFLNERIDASSITTHLDERALEEVYGHMQQILSGEPVSLDDILTDSAARLYAVAGSKVIDIAPTEPYEMVVHDIGEGMRSVRAANVGGRDVLLLGVKRGCLVYDVESKQKRYYPLPDLKTPRGGVNAVAVHGSSLFATHSEFGLALWNLNEPGKPAELLYDSITSSQKTTRAVQTTPERLLFASGSDIYSIVYSELSAAPQMYRGSHGPVTSIVNSAESLYASTEDGVILQWDIKQPDYPSVLLRKNDPIYGLHLARLRGVAHLMYSFNDTSLHARVIGQTLEVEFEALGATFTVFDAASDLVCASGQRGRTLFLWKPSSPRRPLKTIDLSKIETKEIMDLCIRRAPKVSG